MVGMRSESGSAASTSDCEGVRIRAMPAKGLRIQRSNPWSAGQSGHDVQPEESTAKFCVKNPGGAILRKESYSWIGGQHGHRGRHGHESEWANRGDAYRSTGESFVESERGGRMFCGLDAEKL